MNANKDLKPLFDWQEPDRVSAWYAHRIINSTCPGFDVYLNQDDPHFTASVFVDTHVEGYPQIVIFLGDEDVPSYLIPLRRDDD